MISAIIPARNEEANIARAIESVQAQPEISEIIVVNDGSTDGTGAILSDLRSRIPALRVLETEDLPAGWIGKNHAVALGASSARGDWLLFLDADSVLCPGAARRALSDAQNYSAVLVSYSPEQEMGSLGEQILIPFVFARLSEHYSFDRVNDPGLPDAAANGQFLMIRRDVYDSVGGHAAIRARVLEDVALARLVKSSGHNIFFGPGQGIARTRMYHTFRSMWEGWTKNLYALLGGTPGALILELLETFPWLELALVTIGFIEARRGHWLVLLAAAVVLLGRHIRYAHALRRNRMPLSLIQYVVPGALLYSAVSVTSYWKSEHGSIAWKGRKYPAGTS
jgi:chlorobactene glucosyltransferase